MIAGTIIMEDSVIHFKHDRKGHVELTVSDALTGREASKTCTEEDFCVALGVAMHPEGCAVHISEQEYDSLVTAVTPIYYEPLAGADELMEFPLRWLP